MRKIINAPGDFVDEVIEGILLAHGDDLSSVTVDNRALVSREAGAPGKVGIVTGGGSGHLPLFLGFVGTGLATGVAVGNVFSSPSAEQIHAATIASDGGAGVLYLYGNYGGDIYNFDAAAEMALGDGVRTTTVLGTDDILSAPADAAERRRGVAGIFFAYKAAGAAAARGDSLEAVTEIAQRVVDRTRTMGVGLAPTILPAAGEPSFVLGEGEMEVGVGIHGEPGHHRGPLETADEIAERFVAEILRELPLRDGDEVAVLVNGLGSTPLEELYLIFRYTHEVLNARGVTIRWRFVGELVTSLEMAGASLSVLHLDDELAELMDRPAYSPFYTHRAHEALRPEASAGGVAGQRLGGPMTREERPVRTVERPDASRSVVMRVASQLPAHADELRDLDAALGDGDLGITISTGAEAVAAAVGKLPENAHAAEVFSAAGRAFATANPSTYAALVGGGLSAMARALEPHDTVDASSFAAALQSAQSQIMSRGGAELGDKTVVDVLARIVLELGTESGSAAASAAAAAEAAARAVDDGVAWESKRGRAGWMGARTVGHVDPGSRAMQRIAEAVAAALSDGQ